MKFIPTPPVSTADITQNFDNFVKDYNNLKRQLGLVLANLLPEDNFSGRSITYTVTNNSPFVVASSRRVSCVGLRQSTTVSGRSLAVNLAWRSVAAGAEITVSWEGVGSAVVELFVEES